MQSNERSKQENFGGNEKKDHIMQILGPVVEGICVCVSYLDQNLGDASLPFLL